MHKDVLQGIVGVEIFPIISLGLFLFASLMIGLRVWRMSRREIQEMSRLPLDDDGSLTRHEVSDGRRD